MKKITFLLIGSFIHLFLFAQLKSFHLSDVTLLASPFTQAQETDKKYILSLQPDRLLAPFLKEAGLPVNAENYGNWENTGLDGHIGGHYISALANMYASTGDTLIKQRLTYMIKVLGACQDAVQTGYIGGTPGGKQMWEDVRAGNIKAEGFALNKKWVPLYNIHKTFAGLIDAFQIGGIAEAKPILFRLSNWFYGVMNNLSDTQIQDMLHSEHGGMNEALLDVYLLSNDKRYLELAKRFSHRFILHPLLENRDTLTKLHANTQIPKVIGFARIAAAEKNPAWQNASAFFWETVTKKRSISIGGNSVSEHFHPAADFTSMLQHREGPETCNSYNMLKLSKALFLENPRSEYMNFYERTLYNHILSSQHPDGGFVYFTSARPGHYRVYSQPQESFWCCVGSGMENHGKYGEMIYAYATNELYVNLFIPSTLHWREKGLTLTQQTSFPSKEGSILHFKLTHPVKMALKIRNPEWVKAYGFRFLLNGKAIQPERSSDGFFVLDRTWKTNDKLEFRLSMETTLDYLPDGSSWASIRKGPVVMAAVWKDTTSTPGLKADGGRMGHVASGPLVPFEKLPLIINPKVNASEVKAAFVSGEFTSMTLQPFYTIHDSRYILYWKVDKTGNLQSIKEEFTKLDQYK